MNDCPNGELRDRLPDLLHDRLTLPERREVEAHLATCADCRAELALLRSAHASLRRAPAVDVSRIVAALPTPRPTARPAARRSWVGWRTAATITLIAAGGTSVAVVQQAITSRSDSSRATVAPAPSGVIDTAAPLAIASATSMPNVAPAPAKGPELAVAGGAIGDLSDHELSALLSDMESLDAVPSADVDNAAFVSPVSPGTEGLE